MRKSGRIEVCGCRKQQTKKLRYEVGFVSHEDGDFQISVNSICNKWMLKD